MGAWPKALVGSFGAGAAATVLQLAGARVLAPDIGVSIYTWTTLIGSVLAGLAVGGWIGGVAADRVEPRRGLALALATSGAACLAGLALSTVAAPRWLPPNLVARVAWQTATLVLLPSLALGTVTPIAARAAIVDRTTAGAAIGAVYASSAAGAIAGTALTGFVFVDLLGSRGSIVAAAAALSLLALGSVGIASGLLGWLARAVAVSPWPALVVFPAALASPCTMESAYFCIKVDSSGDGVAELRTLKLDKLLHSYYAPGNPTHLEYAYTRHFAAVARLHAIGRPRLRTLFIGGGGYTVPRYVEAVFPHAEVDVAEIDAGVTLAAQRFLGLRTDSAIRTYNQDARQLLMARPASARYDLVFGDAFNDYAVPFHLTTREFARLVQTALEPDGVYALNVVDLFPDAGFARSVVATLESVFPHVGVVLNPLPFEGLPWGDGTSSRTTFVILASDAPLPLDRLGSDPLRVALTVSAAQFDQMLARGRAVVLTDDFAPVDGLTARLFRSRLP